MRYSPLLIAALFLMSSCRDDPPSNKATEEARIQTEVARRVKVVESDLKIRQHRLRTIRIVGFVVLLGGAVTGLVWVRRPRLTFNPSSLPRPKNWTDHHPPGEGRVIDLTAGSPSASQHKSHTPRSP
jgi:hypothetical protein